MKFEPRFKTPEGLRRFKRKLRFGGSHGGAVDPLSAFSFSAALGDAGGGVVDLGSFGFGDASFVRANSATALLNNGTFKSVGAGVARSYYTPAGVYRGYMAEGSRIQLVTQSQNFGATWAAIGTPTRVGGAIVLGDIQLDTIGDDAAGTLEGYSIVPVFTGNAVKAFEIIVKQGTSTSSVIRLRDGTAGLDRLLATITWTGAVPVLTMTTGTDLTGAMEQLGTSGAYILKMQTTAVTAANAHLLELYPATTSVLGVGGTGTIYWGAVQLEDAPFPSTPIISAGSTVSRNTDFLLYPYAGNAVPSAGTVYDEMSLDGVNSARDCFGIAFDTDAGRAFYIGAGNPATVMQIYDGTALAQKSAISSLVTGVRKRVSSWGALGLRVTGDNLIPDSGAFDGNMQSAGIAIGTNTSGNASWFGTHRNVKIWPTQLSLALQQSLTA